MPIIYLSPSTQEKNFYVNGGTEEEWMNRLADEMEPYLTASGIQYVRNTPSMTAFTSIQDSNRGQYDLHLALHSNASPPDQYGEQRGIIAFYYPGSPKGRYAATLIANNLRNIYPLPNKVRPEPTTFIGEVRRVKAPSVFLEIGYHDNPDDAVWIQNNLNLIAQTIVYSLTEYFDIPFLTPQAPKKGVVDVIWGYLNIREQPSLDADIIGRAYDGTELKIINTYDGWYLVQFGNVIGYASSDYITLI